MYKFFLPAALLALFAIFACDKNIEVNKALVFTYAELRIAEQEYGETEEGKAVRFQILESNGFSANAFEERIEELKEEPEKWEIFQKTLINILDSIADSEKSKEES